MISVKIICLNSYKTRIWIFLRIPKMRLTRTKQVANGRASLTKKSSTLHLLWAIENKKNQLKHFFCFRQSGVKGQRLPGVPGCVPQPSDSQPDAMTILQWQHPNVYLNMHHFFKFHQIIQF